MRYLPALLLSVAVSGMLAAGAQTTAPKTHLKIGDQAPDFTLPATTGGNMSLSQFLGKKIVVLAFYPAAFSGG